MKLVPTILLLTVALAFSDSPAAHAASSDSITDREIVLAVESQLAFDDRVSSHMIDVLADDGVVTLEGSVDNLLAKKRAAELAGSVKGVRSG